MTDIPAIKYGVIAQEAYTIVKELTAPSTLPPQTDYKPSTLSPGKFVGDMWVQEDGYQVSKVWVNKYPALFGPLRKDPDGGFGELETDDIISRISAKFTGFGGTFSTWTERHAFITFAGIGFNDVTTNGDVPPIPDFFVGEMAYCYTGLSMGRAAKKLDDAGGLKKVAGLIMGGAVLGNIPRLYGLLTSGAL